MEKYQTDFIKKISTAVKKYAPKYNIKVCSPIIAQAIIESAFGKSKLAEYNNFFGMKDGSSFKGQTIVFNTREVVNGKDITVKATFRAYKTASAGIKGYFEFIDTERYKALKGVTDPKIYLEEIKKAGYATDPNYVNALMAVIDKYNLTQYDPKQKTVEAEKSENLKNVEAVLTDKTIDIIAADVIKNVNYWGCGEVRKNRLYREVQTRINAICYRKIKVQGSCNGSLDSALYFLASDIIKNIDKWGSGKARKENIYRVVQDHINKIVKG